MKLGVLYSTLVEELLKNRCWTSYDCLLLSKNSDTTRISVYESAGQLLALATKPYRRFPMSWACLPKTTLAFSMCSFPLALVLWIMRRRIHNQMHDTCFSHAQQMHVLSTKNVTMHDKMTSFLAHSYIKVARVTLLPLLYHGSVSSKTSPWRRYDFPFGVSKKQPHILECFCRLLSLLHNLVKCLKTCDESKKYKSLHVCFLGEWRACHKIKQHRAMCRRAAWRQIYHRFSHTVQCDPTQVDLTRLRYTCTVLAAGRAGRACLYKSSVSNTCFFLHHDTAFLLPKKNSSSIMFAPPSKKYMHVRFTENSASASFLASHVFLPSLLHSLTDSKRPWRFAMSSSVGFCA